MTVDFTSFKEDVAAALVANMDSVSWMANTGLEDVALHQLMAPARSLLSEGKRTRATLVLAGYSCAFSGAIPAAIHAGAAMELYQASALVHDDVVDDSDVRRGMPAAHKRFASDHAEAGWRGSATDFGTAAAIMLGDLLLSQSMVEFARTSEYVPAQVFTQASRIFHTMSAEVAYGQFLDVRAENMHTNSVDQAISTALSVINHKTVRYSIEAPLTIGAILGGADAELLHALGEIGTPLGEAFQLRDDDLGIFGDEATTGKPACGDIAEGKRTVLLALTLDAASSADAEWIEGICGNALTASDVIRVRSIVEETGARSAHEQMIAERELAANSAIAELSLHGARPAGVEMVEAIASALAARAS